MNVIFLPRPLRGPPSEGACLPPPLPLPLLLTPRFPSDPLSSITQRRPQGVMTWTT